MRLSLSLAGLSTLGFVALAAVPLHAQEGEPAVAAPVTTAAPAEPAAATEPGDEKMSPARHGCCKHHGEAQGGEHCSRCQHEGHAEPSWSLGAGLLGGSVTGSTALFSSLGVLGYGALSATSPSYTLSAERRLADGLWLAFTGSLQYVRGDVPVSVVSGTEVTVLRSVTTGNLSAGVRYVLFTDVVDVSVYGMLGGTWGYLGGDTRDASGSYFVIGAAPSSWAYALGGSAGVSVERKLIDRLALRLSTSLVEAYYTTSRIRTLDTTGNVLITRPKGMSGGIALRPALEVRLYF